MMNSWASNLGTRADGKLAPDGLVALGAEQLAQQTRVERRVYLIDRPVLSSAALAPRMVFGFACFGGV
jgi:hypothetical protein